MANALRRVALMYEGKIWVNKHGRDFFIHFVTNVHERDDSDTDEFITMTNINVQASKLIITVLYLSVMRRKTIFELLWFWILLVWSVTLTPLRLYRCYLC